MTKDETIPDEIQTRNEIMAGFDPTMNILARYRHPIKQMKTPSA